MSSTGARGITTAAIVALAILSSSIATAQICDPSWDVPMFENNGMNAVVYSTIVWDDGSGPALYAGGAFTNADGVAANRIAKWDGNSWLPLNQGVNGDVRALAVFDDGSGEALYVGGEFTQAGGMTVNYIARWNGAEWSALAAGLNGPVYALLVYDDGSGEALYVGGNFGALGGVSPRIGRWTSEGWSTVGSGMSGGQVNALAAFDDGTGMKLIAGGSFTSAGMLASRLAQWDGATWSKLHNGVSGIVYTLASANLDDQPLLFIGGAFTSASGLTVDRITQWNGTSYAALGSGVNNMVRVIRPFEIAGEPVILVGGSFSGVNGVAGIPRLARWDGANWSSPISPAPNATVFDLLASHHDDAPPGIIVSGNFTGMGSISAGRIAEWRPPQEPYILIQPEGVECDAGNEVELSVAAASYEPLEYEWRRNGKPIDESEEGIEGADTPTLTIAPAAPSHSGMYEVWITNECGETVSQAAEVIVKDVKTPGTPGDLNGDGHVDVQDLLILLSSWGDCPKQGDCPADLNESGNVDVQDLLILLGNWG